MCREMRVDQPTLVATQVDSVVDPGYVERGRFHTNTNVAVGLALVRALVRAVVFLSFSF